MARAEGQIEQVADFHRQPEAAYRSALVQDHRVVVRSVFYNLALLQLEQERFQEAMFSLQSFLQDRPDHPDGNLRMGWTLLQLDRAASAETYLAPAAKLNPTAQIFSFLAEARRRQRRLQGSIETYQRALRHFPDHPQLHYELGLACDLTNNRQPALEYLKRALQLGSSPRFDCRWRLD